MNPPATLLVLPGLTGRRAQLRKCRELVQNNWPEARVIVLDCRRRSRGVPETGRWLDQWTEEKLSPEDSVFIFAYVLGGSALAYAPKLVSRARKIVIVRSRFQEGVPRRLCQLLSRGGARLLFGRGVADLGRPPFWPPGFSLPCPHLTLVETRPTRLARWLQVRWLTDTDLGLSTFKEVAINHHAAYQSPWLINLATDWLRS